MNNNEHYNSSKDNHMYMSPEEHKKMSQKFNHIDELKRDRVDMIVEQLKETYQRVKKEYMTDDINISVYINADSHRSNFRKLHIAFMNDETNIREVFTYTINDTSINFDPVSFVVLEETDDEHIVLNNIMDTKTKETYEAHVRRILSECVRQISEDEIDE